MLDFTLGIISIAADATILTLGAGLAYSSIKHWLS